MEDNKSSSEKEIPRPAWKTIRSTLAASSGVGSWGDERSRRPRFVSYR